MEVYSIVGEFEIIPKIFPKEAPEEKLEIWLSSGTVKTRS